jgi:putative transposase
MQKLQRTFLFARLPRQTSPVRIEVPRDRDGSVEPLLIAKHARRFTGFDDKIIAL